MEPSNAVQDEFGQVVEKLKSANNLLVTISTNPTVDQFAACIGLTLVLNKIGKHANAVFSGRVPSTLDFLKPEKTIEKNTDSLRDFIIALDKSKADKLRYKVENDVVKIFITPYRTSISEKDLQFSQGDFNVDAIVALGVHDKQHIDSAIMAHGRILHDATVIAINTAPKGRLGTINWADDRASSLCEMVADVATELDNKVFDAQNATALLTGIVAETDRYSNDKAAPHTMSVAGLLMAAGASTQLVSSKLEDGGHSFSAGKNPGSSQSEEPEDGVLEIDHISSQTSEDSGSNTIKDEVPYRSAEPAPPYTPRFSDSPEPTPPSSVSAKPPEPPKDERSKPRIMHEPPGFGGRLTANTEPEDSRYTGSTDPLSNLPETPLLDRNGEGPKDDALLPASDESITARGKDLSVDPNQTLSQIEEEVGSPHASTDVDAAREAVMRAQANIDGEDTNPEPRQDLGTTELGSNLNDEPPLPPPPPVEENNDNKLPPPPPVPPPPTPPPLT